MPCHTLRVAQLTAAPYIGLLARVKAFSAGYRPHSSRIIRCIAPWRHRDRGLAAASAPTLGRSSCDRVRLWRSDGRRASRPGTTRLPRERRPTEPPTTAEPVRPSELFDPSATSRTPLGRRSASVLARRTCSVVQRAQIPLTGFEAAGKSRLTGVFAANEQTRTAGAGLGPLGIGRRWSRTVAQRRSYGGTTTVASFLVGDAPRGRSATATTSRQPTRGVTLPNACLPSTAKRRAPGRRRRRPRVAARAATSATN